MDQEPKNEISNAEREARKIFRDKVKLSLSNDPTAANRPLVCAEGSMVTVKVDGNLIPAFVKEGKANVYLLEVRYPSGAKEFGVYHEEEIEEKLN